jgi:hypothetical protein
MQLNLPFLDQLDSSKHVLIAGAGGGFDFLCGLPIYFTLRALGKQVSLANYSFTELALAQIVSEPEVLIDKLLIGARGSLLHPLMYYPEGYLAQWFKEVRDEEVIVWMFAKTGASPLSKSYAMLAEHLGFDALILVDGGVDSLMCGDEVGSGTLLEDTISLVAATSLNIPVKILACIGFGTEVEEQVCHYRALENIACLAREGAFLGSCALTPQMEAFELFEAASCYIWEQPEHPKSHISTRIIPAVHGEFENYHMYDEHRRTTIFVSPMMSLYWFFDASKVVQRSKIADALRTTMTFRDAITIATDRLGNYRLRPRKAIPY